MKDLPGGAPRLNIDEVAAIASEVFGVEPTAVKDLGSYQDRNFLISSAAGKFVLKVAHAQTPADALVAQNEAMAALADLDISVPTPVPSLGGPSLTSVTVDGEAHNVRLLTFVEGVPMTEFGYLNHAGAQSLGRLSGSIASRLATFNHPGAHRLIQWDVSVFDTVVDRMAPALDRDEELRVRDLAQSAKRVLDRLSDSLPKQVIHGDVTDFNVVAQRGIHGRPLPTGLIDFGDLVYSWRAAEAAVTISSQLVKNLAAPLEVAAQVFEGFASESPLTAEEVEALWPMIVARACVGLVSTAYQLTQEPDNDYLRRNLTVDRAVLNAVEQVPFALGHAVLAQAAGIDVAGTDWLFEALAREPRARLLPGHDLPLAPRLDLSVMSDLMSQGSWLDPATLRARIDAHLGDEVAVIEYGEAHLFRASINESSEPETIHLGLDVVAPAGSPVCAPIRGTVTSASKGAIRLATTHGFDVLIRGIAVDSPGAGEAGTDAKPGTEVAAGTRIGKVAAVGAHRPIPPHIHLQLVRSDVQSSPAHVRPSLASAWSVICPDPALILGRPSVVHPENAQDLRERRLTSLAHVQKHYYETPPRIERGWRQYLCDINGRVYLDGVNNVTVLGHSHPAVEEAVSYQLRTLNTNSRFHYAANVDFAHALLQTMPAQLSRVFLVSTGSESVDLALRLARVFTEAKDTIALRTAYHGWTAASDEVSSALMDNPRALETRPDWIHLAEPPNLYRGPFRGDDAGTRYAEDVRRIVGELAAVGTPLAAFICETLNGNAGGIMLPDDYLSQVYRDVRAAGGVVIADEVQVGYGRLGEFFWGFQLHGVIPDIVCLAKATGNGYPVAAVVCADEIADAFAAEGSLFASTGGSPAGAVAAIATLATIQAEDLQGNAARVGSHLRAGLQRLVDGYEMAGAVHGMGLYLGLEIVTDKGSQTPATAGTAALCERLLELGVVMQPTGDYSNVLKIKPPLCIDLASADFLIECIETALRDGW
ncbi:MAG: aminotransferase [Candidatus Nanopelagicales bacterium]